jgi:hypothetical protein
MPQSGRTFICICQLYCRRALFGSLWLLLAVALLATPAMSQAQAGDPPVWSTFLYLPLVQKPVVPYRCPTISPAVYNAIPYEGNPTDRPAELHADLNLALRGYAPAAAPLVLVSYDGGTDGGAPQMPGLFADRRVPVFTAAYQAYDWNWACGQTGCRGPLLADWPATLLGMATSAGEAIRAPARSAAIYPGGYIVVVLYAAENRITLKYTCEDNVISGYTVHIENVCVDPALLRLYRDLNAMGRPQLPALRNDEALGTGSGDPILVAVRDNGQFLDPRSRKDWWQSTLASDQLLPPQLDGEAAKFDGPAGP